MDLPQIARLEADTKLDAGVTQGGNGPEFNNQSALRDDTSAGLGAVGRKDADSILTGWADLRKIPLF